MPLSFELDIAPGEIIGIVGRSGSGKSTLTKLVQRLYVPERGRVLIDGHDLALADPAWLRRQLGVVLQENFLFNRSVRENIALADHYAALIDNWSRLSWTDGFHPNTAGYATMAQVWSDAMKTPDLTPILMLLLDE